MTISDTITMRGRVGTDITVTNAEAEGDKLVARFRIAVPRSRRNDAGEWVEGDPLWYTVRARGALAEHVAFSVSKGDPVIVTGHPRAHAWITKAEELRSEVGIIATSIGHDLVFGNTTYTRASKTPEKTPEVEGAPF